MEAYPDWIWDILRCPECAAPFEHNVGANRLSCTNPTCGYQSVYTSRYLNLLPRSLDQHQHAENEFRVDISQRMAQYVSDLDQARQETYKLLNVITYYSFTSQYFYFRDFFSRRYKLAGRGLEIGGAMGQLSGFVRLFYPNTQMVTSDVAPYNVITGVSLADRLHFDTDVSVMADAERLPFEPGSFDFICSSGMLHHLGDLPRALEQGRAVLKPGGHWYAVNELAIGSLPRRLWNSRYGQKGRWAGTTGIRENSYTLKEWLAFFARDQFEVVDLYFNRNPRHKLESWSRALYYASIARLPERLVRMGLPCEVNFVLQKK
jgi:SAM-dependent methyltransferase